MIVRKSTSQEARRINELFAICFEMPYSNCPIDPEHDDATHWAAFDDDGEMMSNFTIGDFAIQFDGHVCKMGGIGGVATLPQYRRRGGIRACFQEALPDMYARGYDFSYLYPFSTYYYRKFGYECCVQKFGWAVNLGLLNPPKTAGSFRLAEKNHPMTQEIRSLDQLWEAKYNMMVQHGEDGYDWAAKTDPAVKQEFTYVCFDENNAPNAYVSFKIANEPDGRNILCNRFCFADKGGFLELMQLFKSLSADHTFAKFKTPATTGLQYLMPEWSQGAVKWDVLQNAGMVRVINVQSVLEKAAYRGSGCVKLVIQDGQILENCGCYAVTFENSKAVSVEKTQGSGDAAMPISTFSALIAGVCGFEEAKDIFGGLEVSNNTPALSQVFYRKPLMIVDYF